MALVVDQGEFVSVVAERLSDFSGRDFGRGMVPSERPEMPYGIVYFIWSATGLVFDVYQHLILFQVTLVGEGHDQVTDLSGQVMQALLGRDSNGFYARSLPPGPSLRRVAMLGGIVPAGGELLQEADTYRIEVRDNVR